MTSRSLSNLQRAHLKVLLINKTISKDNLETAASNREHEGSKVNNKHRINDKVRVDREAAAAKARTPPGTSTHLAMANLRSTHLPTRQAAPLKGSRQVPAQRVASNKLAPDNKRVASNKLAALELWMAMAVRVARCKLAQAVLVAQVRA